MKVIYKRIKVAVPHCSVCGEWLHGDNSLVSPYYCSCGTWRNSWENPFEYKLVEIKTNSYPFSVFDKKNV